MNIKFGLNIKTHHPCEELKSSEPCGVADIGRMHNLWDCDEAEVDEEGEEVELQQPLKEQEVGEDRSAKPAPNLLQGVLPHNQTLPG